MVTEDGERISRNNKPLHPLDDTHTVRATITEIADEHQLAAMRMAAFPVVPEMTQQGLECLVLTMDIANDIKWPVRQVANQSYLLQGYLLCC